MDCREILDPFVRYFPLFVIRRNFAPIECCDRNCKAALLLPGSFENSLGRFELGSPRGPAKVAKDGSVPESREGGLQIKERRQAPL